MSVLSSVIDTGAVSSQVLLYTGSSGDAATAGAYAAWIAGVTGTPPVVKKGTGGTRAVIELSGDQVIRLRGWLNGQVGGMLSPSAEPALVEYNLGRYLGPWALQYAVPLVLGALVAGWVGHWLIYGRK